jgi:hypothetical protein
MQTGGKKKVLNHKGKLVDIDPDNVEHFDMRTKQNIDLEPKNEPALIDFRSPDDD